MNGTTNQQVTLRVHLSGVIALVPHEKNMWVLMPNALLPSPAQWRETKQTDVWRARAHHVGLFLTRRDQVAGTIPNELVNSVVSRWNDPPEKGLVVMSLVGEHLDFLVEGPDLKSDPKIDESVPNMAKIAPSHRLVSRKFLPTHSDFDPKGLSAALLLKTGDLSVEGYFDNRRPVDFAYVKVDEHGNLDYEDRVGEQEIANRLLWTVPLPDGARTVVVDNIIWKPKGTKSFTLKPSPGCDYIDVWIMHSEVDIPALFIQDPYKPEGVQGLPDPDFEAFYQISANPDDPLPKRVPVPPSSIPGGTAEKPCSGSRFGGFDI